MELEKFEQLSKKVDALLARVEDLSRTKTEHERLLEEYEEETKNLKTTIAAMEQERSQVRAKVDELLERIGKQLTE
ncbi:MAG: cell division protein ZapB [Pseudomonadota bacterium]